MSEQNDDDQHARPRPPEADARRHKRRKWIALAALLTGPLLAEGAMRYLLFGESDWARARGAKYRDARLFVDPHLDDRYWRLARVLTGDHGASVSAKHHPLLGWVARRIDVDTLAHSDAEPGSDKDLLLVYGASFIQSLGRKYEPIDAHHRRSDLADTTELLNYGVGGYGLGQMHLLLRESIDLYADREPTVAIGVVIESDLHRSSLAFRGMPKPRMRVVEGSLVDGDPVPYLDPGRYLEEHGTGIRSYAWAYFLRNAGWIPEPWRASWGGWDDARREQQELIRAILLELHAELEGRDLEHFLVLCSGAGGLRRGRFDAFGEELVAFLDEHGVPFLDTRPAFRAACAKGYDEVYVVKGHGKNHPNPQGNALLYQELREGLNGRRDGKAR